MPKDASAVPTSPDLSRTPLNRTFWRSRGVSIGLLSYSRQVITLGESLCWLSIEIYIWSRITRCLVISSAPFPTLLGYNTPITHLHLRYHITIPEIIIMYSIVPLLALLPATYGAAVSHHSSVSLLKTQTSTPSYQADKFRPQPGGSPLMPIPSCTMPTESPLTLLSWRPAPVYC
jgi:hypothetical protein